jgi:hypothetical protein
MDTSISNRASPTNRRGRFAADRWVWGFIALVLAATSAPHLLGFATQGEAYRFTGFVFGVEDGNSYLAKMMTGSYGDWLFRSAYTAEPQNGMFIHLSYLILGKLAAPPGLHDQLAALFHLYRLAASTLVILATYDFLAFFQADIRLRRLGLALVTLGSGLGWLLLLMDSPPGSLPLDFYSPETFGFLSIYGLPHLAMARAFMLWALLQYLWAVRQLQEYASIDALGRRVVKLAALWLLAGLAQPLVALIIGVVICWHLAGLGAWLFSRHLRGLPADGQRWRRLLVLSIVAGILPGMLVLYNAAVAMWDPYVKAWTAQNLILSPSFWYYLLAYGLLLPYAWAGGKRLLRNDPWVGWLPAGWILLLPLLAYAPLGLQRRLPDGIWVAWVTVALAALPPWPSLDAPAAAFRRYRLVQAPCLLLFPGMLILLLVGLLAARSPHLPIFRPVDEVKTFEFLQADADPGSVVLAAFNTGNALPAWAPVRVLVGHGPESANLARLRPQVKAFYQPDTTDGQRLALIHRYQIRYVFWGPAERSLGGWNPSQASFLQLAARNGDYFLFAVVP